MSEQCKHCELAWNCVRMLVDDVRQLRAKVAEARAERDRLLEVADDLRLALVRAREATR